MGKLIKIGARNLLRYKRRTLLTLALICIGMIFFLVFMAIAGSFKNIMISQITDSFLGHMQIHQRGYLAAIETLPLHLNIPPDKITGVEEILNRTEGIEAYSKRVKFGAGFSNFKETTNIRINGVDPESEFRTCPLLLSRLIEEEKETGILVPGKILVPVLLAKGMGVKVDDTVVLVATNRDGSVNGKTFIVSGILESATGPGGRDGYIHIDDARELLRITGDEVSEFAIRVAEFDRIDGIHERLTSLLAGASDQKGKPGVDVQNWEKLSPFSNVADMIDTMSIFLRILLISIVLISIMSVMIMAVYERVREIGTIAAIGTLPSRILSLFMIEGFLLGMVGAAVGSGAGSLLVYVLNLSKVSVDFGRYENIVLAPVVSGTELITTSVLVVAVAVIASLQPAWKASRLEPIDALGHI
ncbi:ABC transporter permease [candidate division KSB1 bacterium]